jgi:hypothetical protein
MHELGRKKERERELTLYRYVSHEDKFYYIYLVMHAFAGAFPFLFGERGIFQTQGFISTTTIKLYYKTF